MEIIDELVSNNTTNIAILTSASIDVSVKFLYQFIHIFNSKEIFNVLKGSTKMKNREQLFKYQSLIYNLKVNKCY